MANITDTQRALFDSRANDELYQSALAYGLEYLHQIEHRKVAPDAEAIRNLDAFVEPLPEQTSDALQVLQKLQKYGAPATMGNMGSRYFGFVMGNVVPAGMAAKLLSTFWDQVSAMYITSPLAARLEQVVEGWLRQLCGLPDSVVAGFVSGSSTANLCGIAAARYRLLKNRGWDVNRQGLRQAPALRILAGNEAHGTVLKMISLLGLGLDEVQFIDTDAQGRIRVDDLPAMDDSTLLILQAGNVHSGAFDDFASVCHKAREAGAWVHIDGAFGLWAAAAPSLKHLCAGIEFAHSWTMDGHKTLNTPYDSGVILCADQEALIHALHLNGGYIIHGNDQQRDSMYYTPEMSRRARIIDLWASMRFLGSTGIGALVEGLHQRAQQFAAELSAVAGLQILNEVVFNQVIVAASEDEKTEAVLKYVQEEGICWVGGSTWRGRRVIRISVCSWTTTPADITLSAASFRRACDQLTTATEAALPE